MRIIKAGPRPERTEEEMAKYVEEKTLERSQLTEAENTLMQEHRAAVRTALDEARSIADLKAAIKLSLWMEDE